MKHGLYIGIVLTATLGGVEVMAALQQYSFDRYLPILDRQPFGELRPDPSAAQAAARPAAPPFTKDITMCAITEDDSGIQVGFVNTSVKPPKSYLLRIGEMEDDIELIDADYVEEAALLRKGDEEHWISMRGDVDSMPDTQYRAAVLGPEAAPSRRSASKPAVRRDKAAKRQSYTERLRKRREERARRAEEAKRQGVDLEKQMQQYQMQLIRKGLPPLPMQLTPEMDAQLVEEGVLPPVDVTPPPSP